MSRGINIALSLILLCTISGWCQKGKRQPLKHEQEVRDMVGFLQYMLNTLGDAKTSARDKDVLITESYTKIFRDAKVQVQDDLDENRTVITNKDIPAYLKDVDFFFKDVKFEFIIEKIEEKGTDDDKLFYKVTLTRNLKGVLADGKAVNNTIPRFIEINYDQKAQDLKIVSVYTKEYDEKKALLAWWNELSYEWKEMFKHKMSLTDTVTLEQISDVTQIDSLDLSNNHYIVSIEPVSKLINLRYLNLSNTAIYDLTPARNLTEITHINLAYSKVSDISPLRYAANLQSIDISNTAVKDIGVFEKLNNLQKVVMSNLQVGNYDPLQYLDKLTALNLEGSNFRDLGIIDSISTLEQLKLARTLVEDLSPVKTLVHLTNLDLDSTKISDFRPLASLRDLRILSVNGTAFGSFEPLYAHTSLERIYCDATNIDQSEANEFMRIHPNTLVVYDSKDLRSWWQDLTPVWKDILRRAASMQQSPSNEQLASVTGIDSLNVGNYVSIKSLEPLKKMPMLRILIAANTGIRDLAPVKNHHALQSLDISGTQVTDVAPLRGLNNLRTLKADKSKVAFIDTLSVNKNLRSIYVDGTGVSGEEVKKFLQTNPKALIIYNSGTLSEWWNSLSPEWQQIFRTQIKGNETFTREQLHQLISLGSVQFQNTNVSDLNPLKQFIQIQTLELSGTSVQNLSPLSEMKSLRQLTIRDSPIRNAEPLGSLKDLTDLDLSNTPLEDLEFVSRLRALKSLKVSGTQVRKLKPLEGLRELTFLDCSNTEVRKLNELNRVPLKTLKCFNTNISAGEIRKFKKANEQCEVVYYR